MVNSIEHTDIFEKEFKRLSKKYRSLPTEMDELELQLLDNPRLGEDLGGGLYKIRLAIKSKNKGKSGGLRVITYLITQEKDGTYIYLTLLWDKSEVDNIPTSALHKIIKKVFK
jgi:hypothetical protein